MTAARARRRAPRVRVGDQVDVALAVARLDVLQAVPLLGQRTQRLREQAELRRPRSSARRVRVRNGRPTTPTMSPTSSARYAANASSPSTSRRAYTWRCCPRSWILRNPALPKSRMATIRPAMRAGGASASAGSSSPPKRACTSTGALVRAEIVRIGGCRLLAQGRELPPPDHDLLVVVGHASSIRKSEGFTGCSASRSRNDRAARVNQRRARCARSLRPDRRRPPARRCGSTRRR